MPTQKEWALTNLVLANVFQYLPYQEVARCSNVSRHWLQASTYSTSVVKAEVRDNDEVYHGALQWLAKRNGLRSLSLSVDTRKAKNPKLTGDIEAVLLLLNGHAKTIEELSFYVPVDRFRIQHSQTELMKLYASLRGVQNADNDFFYLPNVHTFHFGQKWKSWKFSLPKLRNLSISVLRMEEGIDFDPCQLESVDIGAVEASKCTHFLEKCTNLHNLVLNVNEFTPQDMPSLWNTICNLPFLQRVVLAQFDDFEMKCNEIFRSMKLPNSITEVYYGLLDPTFHYEFDASQISVPNHVHIFGEQLVVNVQENVHHHVDNCLATFLSTLRSLNVYCPNVERDIGEVDSQILEITDLIEGVGQLVE